MDDFLYIVRFYARVIRAIFCAVVLNREPDTMPQSGEGR
jgi:hypothetical protein